MADANSSTGAFAHTPSTSKPPKLRGPEPDEELHHRCILAASALNALREAIPNLTDLRPECVKGLFDCVNIIATYLDIAADTYDRECAKQRVRAQA